MIKANKTCTCCCACVNVCPKNAINLKKDIYGFQYPEIDTTKCIGCNLCNEVCPDVNPISLLQPKVAYAATNNDKEIQKESTSAGVFTMLARNVLLNNGVVYGCAYDDSFAVRHIVVDKINNLNKLQKSKYIQSDIDYIYKDVYAFLKKGVFVLFSGTPCQIAGLRKYLVKDYPNLLLVDLICHGVSNNDIFKAFLHEFENNNKVKVKGFDFRFKDPFLGNYLTRIVTDKKEYIYPWQCTSYGYLYMMSYITRDSCYYCKYSCLNRVGDISLGDYWNVKKYHPSLDDCFGVSLVLINTDKGMKAFDGIKNNMKCEETCLDYCLQSNSSLRSQPKMPLNRTVLMDLIAKNDYKLVEEYYRKIAHDRNRIRLIFSLKRNLPGDLYNFLKIVFHKFFA